MRKLQFRLLLQLALLFALVVAPFKVSADSPQDNPNAQPILPNRVFLPLVASSSQNEATNDIEQVTAYIMAHPELQASVQIQSEEGLTATVTYGYLSFANAAKLGFKVPKAEVSAASTGRINYNCAQRIGAWASWAVYTSTGFGFNYHTRFGDVARIGFAPSAGFFTAGYIPASNSWVVSMDWTSTNYALKYLSWCQ